MGLLRHAKQLLEEIYPHAANFLGRGAMKAAEAVQKLGLPQKLSEQLLDKALKAIPTADQVVRGGKLALDMYGEFRNDSGMGFVAGVPPFGGIRQNIEYPGYYTKTGYSGLGGGFGKGNKHPKEIFEYGEAFPGDPAMEPARKIREGIARGDHIYEREKPSSKAPTRMPPAPRGKSSMQKRGSEKPSSAAITTKVPSKAPKSIREAMGEPKKKKKQKMVPAL